MAAPESATSKRLLLALERENKALSLRRSGANEAEIAESLGMTKSGAHKAVWRALRRAQSLTAEQADEWVALELDRLDRMQMALWPRALAGDVKAIDRILDIMRRRAKLLGLDAPSRHELTGKDGDPIEVREDPSQLTDEELRNRAERIFDKYREDDAAGTGDPAGGQTP